jgi:hypothetical protein
MKTSAKTDGKYFSGRDTVYLTFKEDSIKFRYSYSGKDSTKYLPSFAPGGVIFVDNAVVRLKGVVKGQYSVACSGTTLGKGNIYLDDNIVYKTDPMIDPHSTDLLGIVAKNDVFITDNIPNKTDININASIYCEVGGFGAQNHLTRAISGNINLTGGIKKSCRNF